MVTVVAALIKENDKILIAKRATGDKNVLGKWEFPGGKVKIGENEKQSIEREINEEFNIDIKAQKFIINNIYEYPSKTIDLRLYECEYVRGKFELCEHSEFRFVSRDEILNYDLCEADIPLARFIKELS